ncbi:hypothetical protein CsSME_00047972 [Camellia sinensis var. sinensis]
MPILGIFPTSMCRFNASDCEGWSIRKLNSTDAPWTTFCGTLCKVTNEVAFYNTKLKVLCDCCFFNCLAKGLDIRELLTNNEIVILHKLTHRFKAPLFKISSDFDAQDGGRAKML